MNLLIACPVIILVTVCNSYYAEDNPFSKIPILTYWPSNNVDVSQCPSLNRLASGSPQVTTRQTYEMFNSSAIPLTCDISLRTDDCKRVKFSLNRVFDDSCLMKTYLSLSTGSSEGREMAGSMQPGVANKLQTLVVVGKPLQCDAVSMQTARLTPNRSCQNVSIFTRNDCVLEITGVSLDTGVIFVLDFGLQSPFNERWQTVSPPLNHVTLISFLYSAMDSNSGNEVFCGRRSSSVRLYRGGRREENVVWTTCSASSVPAAEVYDARLLYLRFTFVQKYEERCISAELMYSFHKKSHQPSRVEDGLWNCSVPNWTAFQRHFPCDLVKDCEGGKDQAQCSYFGHCGHEYLTLDGRCYKYIRNRGQYTSWLDSNLECQLQGGYLASLNTLAEWHAVGRALDMRTALKKYVHVGLRRASYTLPELARWTSADMEKAMEACREERRGLRAAAREHGLSAATLKRHLDGVNKNATGSTRQLGRGSVFPLEVENELMTTILDLEKRFFGLSRNEVMTLAFDVAEKYRIPHSFNKDKGRAGKDWFRLFLKRHPNLSLRQPEATSISRACGFNKETVDNFFHLLEHAIDEHKFTATTIFNVDETGVSTVQKRCHKIVGEKGKHQIGALSSAERGTNTTAVCCFSAAGQYVPPMILFKRKRISQDLEEGKPPGSLVTCNESGWMDKTTFLMWLRHFITVVKPSASNKVLLILDGHASHTKNLEAIELARQSGITMLSLPPHTTHKLQPLDVSFFKPLQTYYAQAIQSWLRSNQGRTVGPFQVCRLFCEAYTKAATMTSAINGFSKCGIWPCNNYFPESEYAPSAQTVMSDIPQSCHCSDYPQQPPRVDPSQTPPRADLSQTPPRVDPPQTPPRVDPSQTPPRVDHSQTPPRVDTSQLLPTTDPPQPPPTTDPPQPLPRADPRQPPPRADPRQPPPRADPRQPPPRVEPRQSPHTTDPSQPLPRVYPHQPTSRVYSRQPPHTIYPPQTPPRTNIIESCSRNHSLPEVSQLQSFRVVKTPPDGRCFFRSIAIGLCPQFQLMQRDEDGNLLNVISRIAETAKADEMRTACVQKMCETLESAPVDASIVNADMPSHIRYDSIENRIQEMAKTDHMPGEIEIIALSKVLDRSIIILKENFTTLTKYFAAETSSPAPPLYVKFTILGQDIGHYDCALASLSRDESQMTASSQSGFSSTPTSSDLAHSPPSDRSSEDVCSNSGMAPNSSGMYSAFSQPRTNSFLKRIQRMLKPTVLTSTPHKKKLVDAQQKRDDIIEKKRKAAERKAALENQRQNKQSKDQKTTCPVEQKKDRKKAKTTKKPQSKSKIATNTQKLSSGKNVENPDWYCFMCTECTVKDMIQCQGGCRRWVHCSCARCGSAHYYYCDVCFAGTA